MTTTLKSFGRYQALGEAFNDIANTMSQMSWMHEEDQIGARLWRMPIVDTKSCNGFNTKVTSAMSREIRSAYSFMGHQLLPGKAYVVHVVHAVHVGRYDVYF